MSDDAETTMYLDGYWYDSQGRLRLTVTYEREMVCEMEMPDE